MKWKLFIGLFFLYFFVPYYVHAQEPLTYNDAYAQYTSRQAEYQKAHDEYVLRRSQYLRFKSLQSEKDARDATVAMLGTRDEVVIAYLSVLQKRLEETTGLTDAGKKVYLTQLTDEKTFFKDHKAKIPSAGTLDDLVADSNLASNRYKDDQKLLYQILFAIANGKITDLRTRLSDNLNNIKSKIETIRNETRPEYTFDLDKLQKIDRYVFESENKLARSEEKQISAQDTTNIRDFTSDTYTQKLGQLGEAQQLLKEASSYMREIINEVEKK